MTPDFARGKNMFRSALILGGFAIAAFFISAPSFAQDWSADPAYGGDWRNEGFRGSPLEIQIMAGGPIDISSSVSEGCAGNVANAPDYNFVLLTGDLSALAISAASSADISLLINAPDGRWYCDDNSAGGSNPALIFEDPEGGPYNIWVGSLSNQLAPSLLTISDIGGN